MSVNGDGEPRPSREQQIRDRIGEIHQELGALLRELKGDGDDEDSPEKRRAAFRLLQGGLILILIGASLGVASAAGWAGRHRTHLVGAAVGVGTAAVIAGSLFGRTGPVPPHSHAGTPPTRATATASVHPGVPSHTPTTAPPTPERTRGIPTAVPVLLPSRGRRPVPSASGAATAPSGPSPTPSRPAPSSTSPPPPPPFTCPAGLVLQIVGIGVYVCV